MKTIYPLFPKLETQKSSLNSLFLISLIQQFCQFFPTLLMNWLSLLPAVLIQTSILFCFLDYLHEAFHWSSSSAFPLHPIFLVPGPRGPEIHRGGLLLYFGLKLSRPNLSHNKGAQQCPAQYPPQGPYVG